MHVEESRQNWVPMIEGGLGSGKTTSLLSLAPSVERDTVARAGSKSRLGCTHQFSISYCSPGCARPRIATAPSLSHFLHYLPFAARGRNHGTSPPEHASRLSRTFVCTVRMGNLNALFKRDIQTRHPAHTGVAPARTEGGYGKVSKLFSWGRKDFLRVHGSYNTLQGNGTGR